MPDSFVIQLFALTSFVIFSSSTFAAALRFHTVTGLALRTVLGLFVSALILATLN